MNIARNKTTYLVLVSIIAIAIAGVAIYFTIFRHSDTPVPQKIPLTQLEQRMDNGKKAEDVGDTKKALDEYEQAAKLCKKDDDPCKVSAELKIQSMTAILAQEQATSASNK